MKTKYLYFLLIASILMSCQNGYENIEGNWYYVTFDEGAGKREDKLVVHSPSFEVLENSNYAKDKNKVFFQGRIIRNADSKSFKVIKNSNYSKDKNNVYIFWYKIPFADPETFTIYGFPYSKDKNRVFCGNISINLNEVESFELLSYTGYSVMDTSVFYRRYSNIILENIDTKVIVYSDAIALINGKKYKGIELIE